MVQSMRHAYIEAVLERLKDHLWLSDTGGGPIDLDSVRCGSAHLESGGGTIKVSSLDGNAVVRSGGGALQVRGVPGLWYLRPPATRLLHHAGNPSVRPRCRSTPSQMRGICDCTAKVDLYTSP